MSEQKNEFKGKILLICGSSQTVVNFRLGLIKRMQEYGYSVSVIALDDRHKDKIVEKDVEFYCTNTDNRSIDPFKMKRLQREYYGLIKKVEPDIVFTFMLKPNIFGIRAARKFGTKKIFAMVEGAGDVFTNTGLKWKIIRGFVCRLYRRSFKSADKVFFLNEDDRKEFIERKLVKPEQCEVIPGIGVDIDRFSYKQIKNRRTFIMVARMLKTKGVLEYCKAARLVKQSYPDAVFDYLGAEGTVKLSEIKEFIDDGTVNYLGTTDDVRPYLETCSMFVLPSSYREGVPMSILEAEATGRGVITTDSVGCKETVTDSYNGFLIERGNINDLADKIKWCIEHPQEIDRFGANSRALVEQKFDQSVINDEICRSIGI